MAKRSVPENDLFRDTPNHPSKKLKLTLPLPPSVNSMYVNTQNGGRRLSTKAQDYIMVSRSLINLAIEEQHWLMQRKSTWYYVDLVFFMPDRRIRDSHNMLKLLMDVMQGVVYKNDYYALPRIQAVEYDTERPRVEVLVVAQSNNARDKGLQLAR